MQALFEGFVRASVTAIEQRDPTTSGHSQRVADLTVALAKAVDRCRRAAGGDEVLGRRPARDRGGGAAARLRQGRGARARAGQAAKKLFDWELTLVEERLDHLRTAARLRLAERELIAMRDGSIDVEAARRAFTAELLQIERWREVVRRANEPALLPEAVEAEIHEVAAARSHTPDKVLRILDDAHLDGAAGSPRQPPPNTSASEVQNHVRHTFEFLRQIPWGQRPEAACPRSPGCTDEAVPGRQRRYPRGGARPAGDPDPGAMMTVADIFDALTAADRPLQKSGAPGGQWRSTSSTPRPDAGKLDRVVLEVFVKARVYDRLVTCREAASEPRRKPMTGAGKGSMLGG